MTHPTNSIEVITRYEKGKETEYSVDGGKTYMTKTEFEAAKVNSEDSELMEILNEFATDTETDLDAKLNYTIREIKRFYISRKEVEEAIGKDRVALDKYPPNDYVAYALGRFRQELRAKLLPPTKGEKE